MSAVRGKDESKLWLGALAFVLLASASQAYAREVANDVAYEPGAIDAKAALTSSAELLPPANATTDSETAVGPLPSPTEPLSLADRFWHAIIRSPLCFVSRYPLLTAVALVCLIPLRYGVDRPHRVLVLGASICACYWLQLAMAIDCFFVGRLTLAIVSLFGVLSSAATACLQYMLDHGSAGYRRGLFLGLSGLGAPLLAHKARQEMRLGMYNLFGVPHASASADLLASFSLVHAVSAAMPAAYALVYVLLDPAGPWLSPAPGSAEAAALARPPPRGHGRVEPRSWLMIASTGVTFLCLAAALAERALRNFPEDVIKKGAPLVGAYVAVSAGARVGVVVSLAHARGEWLALGCVALLALVLSALLPRPLRSGGSHGRRRIAELRSALFAGALAAAMPLPPGERTTTSAIAMSILAEALAMWASLLRPSEWRSALPAGSALAAAVWVGALLLLKALIVLAVTGAAIAAQLRSGHGLYPGAAAARRDSELGAGLGGPAARRASKARRAGTGERGRGSCSGSVQPLSGPVKPTQRAGMAVEDLLPLRGRGFSRSISFRSDARSMSEYQGDHLL